MEKMAELFKTAINNAAQAPQIKLTSGLPQEGAILSPVDAARLLFT